MAVSLDIVADAGVRGTQPGGRVPVLPFTCPENLGSSAFFRSLSFRICKVGTMTALSLPGLAPDEAWEAPNPGPGPHYMEVLTVATILL